MSTEGRRRSAADCLAHDGRYADTHLRSVVCVPLRFDRSRNIDVQTRPRSLLWNLQRSQCLEEFVCAAGPVIDREIDGPVAKAF